MKNEIRTFELDSLEIRVGEGDSKKIRGHAAVFDKLSEDLGGFREIIDRGAFTGAVKRDDVRALFNHDPNYILGRNRSSPKTLTLEEDVKGLAIEIDPPDTQYARDLMVSIGRRDISQMSFAFRIDGKKGESWEVDGEEKSALDALMAMFDDKKHEIVRHVIKARLYDVSPVTFPAYTQTDVKVRSLLDKAGVDYEVVAEAMAKRTSGEELDSDELKVLAEAGEIINKSIPRENNPDDLGPAPKEGADESLDLYQRKIAIAEL